MKLRLGKIKSQEMATWFAVKYNTYKNNIPGYLAKLEDYCDFERVRGGVIIKEIYIEEYDKYLNKKAEQMYLNEIEDCVKTQDGLASISGMAKKFISQGKFKSETTAERQLSKAGNKLFGITKDLCSIGECGKRNYVWAIKLTGLNKYRLLTPEEEVQFDDIISSCYSEEPHKIKLKALLEDRLRNEEITTEEYFTEVDRLGLNLFTDCIFQFKKETGHMIVRCTIHELIDNIEEYQNREFNFE